MLYLCQHEALDIKPFNVLNDIANHWRNCQLEEKNNRNIEGAHIRGTDKPDSSYGFLLSPAVSASWVGLKGARVNDRAVSLWNDQWLDCRAGS